MFNHLLQEDAVVQLAAKHFFVQYHSDDSTESTKSVVRDCVTSKLLEEKSEAKWIQMVHTAHVQVWQIFMCSSFSEYFQ